MQKNKARNKILIITATILFLVFYLFANVYVSINYRAIEKKAKMFDFDEAYVVSCTE
jgi:hypothetical protein